MVDGVNYRFENIYVFQSRRNSFQRGGFGNFLEASSEDLARAGFRNGIDDDDASKRSDSTDVRADFLFEFVSEIFD